VAGLATAASPMKTPIADDLGIDLASRREEELLKRFLVCLLFGKPIQREIAERTYRKLVHARIVSPSAKSGRGSCMLRANIRRRNGWWMQPAC
jgi:hypothetical protein